MITDRGHRSLHLNSPRFPALTIAILTAISLAACGENTWSPPTPLSSYTGLCTFWSRVSKTWEGNTCVWGVPTSAETSVSGVWIHFSERNHPYPDFAGRITTEDIALWGFKVTGNNVSARFTGHCIEIHGYLKHEYNHCEGQGVDQPIIDISHPDQIVFCD